MYLLALLVIFEVISGNFTPFLALLSLQVISSDVNLM